MTVLTPEQIAAIKRRHAGFVAADIHEAANEGFRDRAALLADREALVAEVERLEYELETANAALREMGRYTTILDATIARLRAVAVAAEDALTESNGVFDNEFKAPNGTWEFQYPVHSFTKAIRALDAAYTALHPGDLAKEGA